MSRAAAKESFAAARLICRHDGNHGHQPWLSSFAAYAAEFHNFLFRTPNVCVDLSLQQPERDGSSIQNNVMKPVQ